MDNERIVREFIEAWSRLDPEELSRYFTEDGVYHHMPTAPVTGRKNVQMMIAGFIESWTETEWEIRHLLSAGDVVIEVDGKPVGAAFNLLDYNPRIKQIDGKLFPFGFIRLLWNRKAIKRVRMISTNVLPEWQKWGLGLVVMGDLLPRAMKWGMVEGEFSWVLESNHLSYKSLKRGGATISKTYRIYDYGDDPPEEEAS